MKKWIGYILCLYVLLCIVVPCTIIDHCEDDQQTDQTAQNSSDKGCNDCSPFSICSSFHVCVVSSLTQKLPTLALYNTICYGEFYVPARSAYYSRPFQPPRMG